MVSDTMNNAMNPPFGNAGGQPGQGVSIVSGLPGAPAQPMMRPGYGIALQPQPQRPFAPPPPGYMPSAPGQPTSAGMPPGGE